MYSRRELLGVAGVSAIAAAAGCINVGGRVASPEDDDAGDDPDGPAGAEAPLSYDLTVEGTATPRDPTATYDGTTMTITGAIPAGSTDADVAVQDVTREALDGRDTLLAEVTVTQDGRGEHVTAIRYRLEVDVEDEPETVQVREDPADGEPRESDVDPDDGDVVDESEDRPSIGPATIVDTSFDAALGSSRSNNPSVRADGNVLTVAGSFLTGSSSCTEAALEEVVMVDDETLHVSLYADDLREETDDDMLVCTHDISPSSYAVDVTFEDALPATVHVEAEVHGGDTRDWHVDVASRIEADGA